MRWIYTSILICGIIVVWSAANIVWSGKHYTGIIKADGKGYYAHLPALFIYNDLNFGHFDSIEAGKYYNENYFYDYRKQYEGKTLNKYFGGTSVAMLPFFAISHAVSSISSEDADGYSKYYQIGVSVAAIVYLLLSLLIMAKSMLLLKFPSKIIALAIPVILFGTNWYYYVITEPSLSHVYSVFFISLFFYLGLKWGRTGLLKLPLMAALFGLIVFIRPVNGMVLLFVPLFFENLAAFKSALQKLFARRLQLMIAITIALAIVFMQALIYWNQTGHFWVYAYEDEGFNFLAPAFFKILFSYKKGLFLYTPMLFVALLGFIYIRDSNKWTAMTLGFALLAITYVLSSWWNWYYGGSFSSRAFIEYYILFFWLIVALFEGVKPGIRRVALTVITFALICLCQFQTFQYRHMIIHWDNMTKEKYWDVFLKLKKPSQPEVSIRDKEFFNS